MFKRGMLGAIVVAAAGICAGSAHAQSKAAVDCEASALRGTVLGQAIEPVVANRGAGICRDATAGGALTLPAPLAASAVYARTGADGTATAGLAKAHVQVLPDLPIPLPIDQLANDLSAITVPVPSVVGDLVNQAGGAVGGLPGTGGTGGTGGGDGGTGDEAGGGLLGNLPVGDLPIVGDLTDGLLGGLLGASARATTRQAPSAITVDVRPALRALLPNGRLPLSDLISADVLESTAAARCVNGEPQLTGSSRIAGLRLLGQDVPANAAAEHVLSLVDTTNLDLSKLDLSLIKLPPGLSFTDPLVGPLLQAAVRGVLAKLPPVTIPETLARVKLTPNAQARTATSLTQQALRVEVSIAGQSVADLVVGEAKVSGEPCAADSGGPGAGGSGSGAGGDGQGGDDGPESVVDAALECTRRKLVLIDVLQRRGRVQLHGAADDSLVGRTVNIVFDGRKRVARAKVRRNRTFRTTAKLPPRRIRFTNDARYQARVGRERSRNLKLHRRLLVQRVRSRNGTVTIAGRVLRPLAKPMRRIVVKRRITCKHQRPVKRFKPRRDGTFRVRLKAPRDLGVAVYRLQTKVRDNVTSPKLFPTFTLPRTVELER